MNRDRTSNGGFQGLGGGGNGDLFTGYRVSVLSDEKSSGDWLGSNVNVLNTTKLHT